MSGAPQETSNVAIVGSGTIGCSWAAAYALNGYRVTVFDASPEARAAAPSVIASMMQERVSSASTRSYEQVTIAESLAAAVASADYVQESVTEQLEEKKRLFDEMGKLAPPKCVLASSTSALLPSQFLATLSHPERAIVAHPFNPPHLVPLVEVVPSPWTGEDVTEKVMRLLTQIGQQPILVRREVEGFVGNRLQAAVICEAVSLVSRGVVSPADLDKCMVYGLGRRWAFMGPFQTMALNSLSGFGDYVRKYSSAYLALARSLRLSDEWPEPAIKAIETYLLEMERIHAGFLDRSVRDEKLARLREFHSASLRPGHDSGKP
jgi:L-gulonate 3-dehydrogenase